ncbi:unknown [Coraliomargarita sp. CAG:312]|nr:unknown [Coraliomargarita sp. CAG:312]
MIVFLTGAIFSSKRTALCVDPSKAAQMAFDKSTPFPEIFARALHMAGYQSDGFCSDHPGFGYSVAYSTDASAKSEPSTETAETLQPPVPKSIPKSMPPSCIICQQPIYVRDP